MQHAMSILGIARHVAGGGAALTVKDLADLVEQVLPRGPRVGPPRAAWPSSKQMSLVHGVCVEEARC